MIADPRRVFRSRIRSRICAWMVTSNAVVGSSAISRRGLQARAIAIITRWRMPPDNWCGYSRTRRPGAGMPTNVSISTVRCLSNRPLGTMMVNRHAMSDNVRNEVSPKSHEWGYKLGSIYIRKVHFRDVGMITQIESKVVNRLRQVTSAIKQDGANQVSIITSTAERQAAVEFAKAAAIRPQIVGEALQQISEDHDVAEALFEILETQKVIGSGARLTVLPRNGELLAQIIAGQTEMSNRTPPPVLPGK